MLYKTKNQPLCKSKRIKLVQIFEWSLSVDWHLWSCDLLNLNSLLSWFNSLLLICFSDDSLWWSSVSSVDSWSDSDDSTVDGAWDAVLEFHVCLWELVSLESAVVWNISDGSSFNKVSDGESLDGLVLWDTSSTVWASDILCVSSSLLWSSVVSSLWCHFFFWMC